MFAADFPPVTWPPPNAPGLRRRGAWSAADPAEAGGLRANVAVETVVFDGVWTDRKWWFDRIFMGL